MKRLINFFKKLFGCKQVCPKCKSNPCKCELEVPAEHKLEVKPVLDESLANACVSIATPTYCKWEESITETSNVKRINQDSCLNEKPAVKKKVQRKKKAMSIVEQEVYNVDSEVQVPVEVTVEKPAETKKKRSRKKKTE